MISLYQIWYDQDAKPTLHSGLLPFDCRDTPEFVRREIAHLLRFYHQIVAHAPQDDYFALLSPKFFEKTGLCAYDVTNFMTQHPNYDIYLINPYPMLCYREFNVIEQVAHHHHGLDQLIYDLLAFNGISHRQIAALRNTYMTTVYCNYWVAKKSFFDQFIPFLSQLNDSIAQMPLVERRKFYAKCNYKTPAFAYPFIFERIISIYLALHSNVRIKPYTYTRSSFFNRVERTFYFSDVRQIYDTWEQQQHDIAKIRHAHQYVKELLYPSKPYTSYKRVNKWIFSLLKTVNRYRLAHIPHYLDKIDRDI